MKKFILFAVMMSVGFFVGSAEAKDVFSPDFSHLETLNGKAAYFEMQKDLVFETLENKKVLKMQRGKPVARVRFRTPINENTDYSYSFTLRRGAANSAVGVCFGGKGFLNAPGSVYFNANGYVYLMGKDNKWKKTDILLDAGCDYKISVKVSAAEKKCSVAIDGIGKAEMEFQAIPAEIVYMMFNPQAPEGNINYISDFKFYFGK